MKFYNLVIVIILISLADAHAQQCFKYTDSSHCYQVEKFKPLVTGIEKKLELPLQILDGSIQLVADINGDCKTELITFSRRGDSIYIVDLVSAATIKRFPISNVDPSNHSILLADLVGDNSLEIIIQTVRNPANPDNFDSDRLICYRLDGSIVWISDTTVNAVNNGNARSGVIGICDFNQDGIPEIYTSNKIFNARTGKKLADGGNNGIGFNRLSIGSYFPISVADNLDADTTDLELAAGFSIYKVIITNPNGMIGNMMIANNILFNGATEDGNTSIADINSDGILDVIVSAPSRNKDPILYAYYLDNNNPILIGYALFPNALQLSHASIGKLNSIGNPSILVNISTKMFSFRFNGSQLLSLDWTLNTTDTSGICGVSLLDINGDGKQEFIHRDMTKLNIYSGEGNNPILLNQIACYSVTARELPILADYNHSGDIKICVTCTDPHPYRNSRITVFGPPKGDRWAPTRGIWNQYAYNPLFINDDLTVPQFQKNQATYKNGKYNNFMQQESYVDSNGMVKKAAASLSGKISCINYDVKTMTYSAIFELYNRKDASLDADTNLIISFYSGDPNTNGIYIGSYHTDQLLLAGDSLLNLVYRFKFNDLKDLFMVVNTKKTGSGTFGDADFIQLECDYTDNLSRSIDIPVIEPIQANICKGDQYHFFNAIITDSGTYEHKIYKYNGCDSVITILQLSTVDTIRIIQSVSSCDSYLWNGRKYTLSGIFTHDTTSINGCDSSTTLNLSIHFSDQKNITQSACDSLVWNGMRLDQSGSYQDRRINLKGCDSITTLELAIHKSDSTVLHVNSCNSYSWNGKNYLQSGIYTLDTINQFGCDSLVQLNLNLNSIINKNILKTACDSYNWNGRNITQSGIYMDTTNSSKGCDSITTLQLIINKSVSSNTVISSCDSYTWNGIKYTQTGSYSFTTQNSNGCDSIANLQLTIHKSSNSITNISRCNSYSWNNMTYTQSGSYPYQTVNANGCDSIATLNLTINKADSILMKQTACNSYNWNNKTYTQSGKYVFQTTNINTCDSIVMLDLTINSSTIKDTSRTICDSLNFLGKTLKTSGHYSFTIPNTQGCDSIINLSLNISSQHYKDSVSNCGSYIWPINGRSYDSSGVYVEKYSNVAGCDSIYLLNLKVNKNYELKEKAHVCKEYIWLVNNQAYTQSGEYIYNLKSTQGCDSVLKLDLTIHPEFHHTDTIIANSDYLWPVNQKIYPASGTYEEDYTSSHGCDSIHLLLLTINKEVSIYYPNVIHPGGINEWFTIFVYGGVAQIKELSIYDRWGSLVWQKESFPPNELQQGWNGLFKGQKALPGVYVWKAEIELQDGSTLTEKGDVTLLR